MKRFFLMAIVATAALGSISAVQAAVLPNGTAVGTFNVLIGLTSKCEIETTVSGNTAINNMSFTYTSFQRADATASTGFNVRCTNQLPYTLALDSSAVTDATTTLAYTLTLSAAAGTGNGSLQAFTVSGNMLAGQAGTCASGTCNNTATTTGDNKKRTLTVTY